MQVPAVSIRVRLMTKTVLHAMLLAILALVASLVADDCTALASAAGDSPVVAIIGTGRVGGALGPRLAVLGIRVVYGSREPDRDDVQRLVQKTGSGAR